MKERKYPIGEQNFPKIREGNYLYVDKTQYIPLLLDQSYYFLSRPRRFGKSLLLSTLESFFNGRRELFKGLAVEKFEWDWSAYPVIRMDLSEGSFSDPGGLRSRLTSLLDYKEKEFGLEKVYDQLSDRFTHLIKRLKDKTGKGVVILIDEYEKPLLDSFNTPFAEEYKNDLSILGTKSGRDTDKLALTGITPRTVKNGIGFNEATKTLVCKKIYRQDLDTAYMPAEVVAGAYTTELPHRMYIGEVVEIL